MKEQQRDSGRWQQTAAEWLLMSIEGLAFLAQVLLCVLSFNTLDQPWLLVLGWALLAIAMLIAWRARVALQTRGGARQDESWLHTRTIVSTGVYALIRHPMYLAFLLISLSLVILSQHWLSAVLGAVVMGLSYNDMRREEKSNLKRFGQDYESYMARVPRMNIVAGAIRLLRSRHLPSNA